MCVRNVFCSTKNVYLQYLCKVCIVEKVSLKVVSKSIRINSAREENSIWNSGKMLNDRLTVVQKKIYKCYVLIEDKFDDIGAKMETSVRKTLF